MVKSLQLQLQHLRHLSTSSTDAGLRVGIVGTGPSAFYTAKYLLKDIDNIEIDMFDRLPTPYGLVRSGVAPDHPSVKNCQEDFANVASDPRCRFFGNVEVGKDIDIEQLREKYSAVVLAYGADSTRTLGIPGEDLEGVYPARTFVNWYNGHPEFQDNDFKLGTHEDGGPDKNAVVIGQGNVAIDVARVLVSPLSRLQPTDITQHALDQLEHSDISDVYVVGRRGHVQSAYTIKEFREFKTIDDVRVQIDRDEFEAGLNEASKQEAQDRKNKRKLKLTQEYVDAAAAEEDVQVGEKRVHFRYLLNPVEFKADPEQPGRVGSVVLERTELTGDAGKQRVKNTGEHMEIPACLVLTSIGYRSVPMPGVPFDDDWKHTIPNTQGRVLQSVGGAGGAGGGSAEEGSAEGKSGGQAEEELMKGMYVTGWLRRGPEGIIQTNIIDAKQVVDSIKDDISTGAIGDVGGDCDITSVLQSSGVDYVTLEGWNKINHEEVTTGESKGKPREKVTCVERMLGLSKQ